MQQPPPPPPPRATPGTAPATPRAPGGAEGTGRGPTGAGPEGEPRQPRSPTAALLRGAGWFSAPNSDRSEAGGPPPANNAAPPPDPGRPGIEGTPLLASGRDGLAGAPFFSLASVRRRVSGSGLDPAPTPLSDSARSSSEADLLAGGARAVGEGTGSFFPAAGALGAHALARPLALALVLLNTLSSWTRMALGVAWMAFVSAFFIPVYLALMPFGQVGWFGRIGLSNYWAHLVAGGMMRLIGTLIAVEGAEHIARRGVIYVSNHTSSLDVLIVMALMPSPTSVIAKKEILYSPFGLIYMLSGNFRVDRKNSRSAVDMMRQLGEKMKKGNISVMIWPEGTRSRDGRLRPFKKGVFHLAVQTGFPIVPVMIEGAHKSWRKGAHRFSAKPIKVRALPPVDTTAWKQEECERRLAELVGIFQANLPEDQRLLV